MDRLYTIIDIETTGGSAHREKIIEIAIAVFDGHKVVEEYETLVNPERSIPTFITRLTGIDNEMVKNAPKFYEVAKDIVEITDGRIFVAHNVRFDYGFIQEEFRRLGFHFSRKQLCTVRLSRKTFPGLRSYSLGKLIKHFGIEVNDRHRAMADVQATVEVFKNILAVQNNGLSGEPFIRDQLKNINLPESISLETIRELPEKTGVYYFRDKHGTIIYIGKSINIQKRIKQHFQNINPKSNKLYQRATQVDYEVTGSELVAFLLESEAIKQFKPDINRASRHTQFKYFIHQFINAEGYIEFGYMKNTLKHRKDKQILSEHLNQLSVKSYLKQIKKEYSLCEKLMGLNQGPGPCFDYGISQCLGACIHDELPESYNQRAKEVAQRMGSISPANILMVDRGRHPEEQVIVLIKDGKYHGYEFFDTESSFFNSSSIVDLIPKKLYYPEQNTIVKRFLDKPNGIQIIPL